MAGMGQLHQELADAEWPLDQAAIKIGAAGLGIAAPFLPGGWGRAAQAGSIALSAEAIAREKEHTGEVDAREVALTAVGAIPGAEELGAATKIKHAGEILKGTQEAVHAAAATAEAVAATRAAAATVGAAEAATAAAKGYDSVKINSNGTVSGKVTPIGSRIPQTTTCSAQGCTQN